jgi:hypothetical protein
MTFKVDDLIQRMRDKARQHQAMQSNGSRLPSEDVEAELSRLRANVIAAKCAHDQLPPLTTYRRGLAARLELWIKRRIKRASHWFTWGQTNFNTSTLRACENILAILTHIESDLSNLRSETNGRHADPYTETRLADLHAQFTTLQTTLTRFLNDVPKLRAEQRQQIDLIADEQRVCFKQLAIQITEISAVGDRAKRNLELRLDGLTRRVDNLSRNREKFDKSNQ